MPRLSLAIPTELGNGETPAEVDDRTTGGDESGQRVARWFDCWAGH